MYPTSSDDTRPDPDICPVCHQHYTEGCSEDCQAVAERRLLTLHVDAGEQEPIPVKK